MLSLLLCACQQQSARTSNEAVPSVADTPIRFDTPKFHHPPRSIRDIRDQLAKLDRSPFDCAQVREDWREAARYVEQTADELELRLAGLTRHPTPLHTFRQGFRGYAERALSVGGLDEALRVLGKGIDAAEQERHLFDVAYFRSIEALIHSSVGDAVAAEKAAALTRSNLDLAREARAFEWVRAFIEDLAGAASAIASGDPRKAEAAIRVAYPRNRWPVIGSEQASYTPWLAAELVNALLQQGRVVEAEVEARHALTESIAVYGNAYDVSARAQVAVPLTHLAGVMLERGRPADAEILARDAIRIMEYNCAGFDSLRLAQARRVLLRVLAVQEDWVGVVREADAVRASFATNHRAFQRLYGRELEIGLGYALAGDARQGVTQLETALDARVRAFGSDSHAAVEARIALGVAAWQAGDRSRALSSFDQALPGLIDDEKLSGAGGRRSLRRSLLHAYMDRIGAALQAGELAGRRAQLVDAMFRAAQVANLGVVQSAVRAADARAAARDPVMARLIREEQDATLGISALMDHLNHIVSLPERQVQAGLEARLRSQVTALRAAKRARQAEIDARYPQFRELLRPRPLSVTQAGQRLRPGEALLMVVPTASHTMIWSVSPGRAPVFALNDIGNAELSSRVEIIRAGLAPASIETLGDIPAFDVAASHDLYQQILAPVKAAWGDASVLFTVTSGALGALPFAVLPTAPVAVTGSSGLLFAHYRTVPWLARTHAVHILPSVSTLSIMDEGAGKKAPRQFLGFGDPLFAGAPDGGSRRAGAGRGRVGEIVWRKSTATRKFDSARLSQLPALPDTEREIVEVARVLDADMKRDVYLRARATEANLRRAGVGQYQVISFATHGLVAGDLDGLEQPALALTPPPSVTAGADDGLLTLSEILGLDLNVDWAVLSACNTGSGDGRASEAISGLGRAFFYAGARSLLVSNWPVHSASTTELIVRLFKLRAGATAESSPAQALRRASVSLIDDGVHADGNGTALFSYAHPIFWAPFTVVGNGRTQ